MINPAIVACLVALLSAGFLVSICVLIKSPIVARREEQWPIQETPTNLPLGMRLKPQSFDEPD
jgi:hypothetical protein